MNSDSNSSQLIKRQNILFENKSGDITNYVNPIVKAMEYLKNSPDCFSNIVHPDASKNKIIERNYIISLAYSLGLLSNHCQRINKIINGEVLKKIQCDNNIKDDICRIYNISHPKSKTEINNIMFIPDLLIHDSNESNLTQEKFQHLVLEAKTTANLSQYQFAWDFCKLNLYQKYLNFRNAVYLIVNTDSEKIKNHLDAYLDKYPNTISENGKLYFLIQKRISSDIEIWEFKKNIIIMENEFGELKGKFSSVPDTTERDKLLNDMRSNLKMRIHAMSLNVDEYNLNSEKVEDLYKIDGDLKQLNSSKILTKIGEEYRNNHNITNND